MFYRLLVSVGLLSIAFPAYADDPKKPVDPAVAIIDQLQKLDDPDPSYSGSSFWPFCHSNPGMTLPKPTKPIEKLDAMFSLVKLGYRAVPALLDHLDDDRRTNIVIQNNLGGYIVISQDKGEKAEDEKPKGKNLFFESKQYTLRVGDLCYVALGQIVNRNYTAVQYIPSGNIAITSVPHSKKLRADLKKQWGNLTEKKQLESLVEDLALRKPEEEDGGRARIGASLRLAYYFPKEYEPIAIKQLNKPTDFIETLHYLEGEKLDQALRDLLAKTEDIQVSFALVNRLAGRGYDADIEAFIKRILPKASERDSYYIQELRNKFGFTRLHIAVELCSPYLIEAALKMKLDINARSKDGRTALHIAATRYDHGTVPTLLNAKANANLRDKDGRTPMDLAALRGDSDLVRQFATVQTEPLDIFSAVILGKAERVNEILKAEPELVKARTGEGKGFTLLQLAASEGHEETTRVLLDAKADVNARGGNPLVWAVMREQPNIKLVKLLIDRGANVNEPDGFRSETPLHLAVESGNAELVKLLLEAKANPTAKDSQGETPLDLAKEKANPVIMKLFESKK